MYAHAQCYCVSLYRIPVSNQNWRIYPFSIGVCCACANGSSTALLQTVYLGLLNKFSFARSLTIVWILNWDQGIVINGLGVTPKLEHTGYPFNHGDL